MWEKVLLLFEFNFQGFLTEKKMLLYECESEKSKKLNNPSVSVC